MCVIIKAVPQRAALERQGGPAKGRPATHFCQLYESTHMHMFCYTLIYTTESLPTGSRPRARLLQPPLGVGLVYLHSQGPAAFVTNYYY